MDVVEDGLSNDVNLQVVVVARHCFVPEVNTAATKPSRGSELYTTLFTFLCVACSTALSSHFCDIDFTVV